MLITLAGHVDHGKSAIVKALTGVDTDRLEEEKQRGLTIDLGFAYSEVNGYRIGFVDVPGHHKFIHNMIAGVAKMQHALVVIAADDGIMPQTREHINILELLGLQRGTVALNKVDRVDPSALSAIKQQVQEFLQPTFLKNANIIEVSVLNKVGLNELLQAMIEVESTAKRLLSKRSTRLNVDRSFSPTGEGTVVTGTLLDGSMSVGDILVVPRSATRVRVKKLVVNGRPKNTAIAGDRCGVQLAGVKTSQIRRGDWLRDPECSLTSKNFTLQLRMLNDCSRQIQSWTSIHLYHGSSHTEGKILPLQPPLTASSSGLVDVSCESALCVALGDRVILRDRSQSQTLGGGVVVSTVAPTTRRRLSSRLENLALLSEAVANDDIQSSIKIACSNHCVKVEELRRSWNCKDKAFSRYFEHQHFVILNDRVLAQQKLHEIYEKIESFLKKFHRQQPTLIGASINAIWNAISEDTETIRFTLEHAVATGNLKVHTGNYSLRLHRATAPMYNRSLFKQIEPLIDSRQPATVGDIARELRIPVRNLEAEMQRFVAAKLLVKVSPKRFYTPTQLQDTAKLVEILSQSGPFSVRDFSNASKIGRMAGIEVLEYFDRIRFTRRDDNVREVIGSYATVNQTSTKS